MCIRDRGILSLQKHHHRAEHWVVTHGKPKITLNKKYFTMKPDETIFIPLGSVHRPWGNYVNLFDGKEFLIKELYIKSKGILSLQKHHHRAEHWVVTQGKPKITLNKKYFTMKPDETIFIPLGSIHRIENPYKKPVKIIEAQVGSILKESDIVRYQDVYGRVK